MIACCASKRSLLTKLPVEVVKENDKLSNQTDFNGMNGRNWNKRVYKQILKLLDSKPSDTDNSDISIDKPVHDTDDAVEHVRDDEGDAVEADHSDSEDSDEEVKELMKRKTDLEAAKTKLTWQKKRQKLEKHRKKQLLLVAVETLANEVKELSTEVIGKDYKLPRLK